MTVRWEYEEGTGRVALHLLLEDETLRDERAARSLVRRAVGLLRYREVEALAVSWGDGWVQLHGHCADQSGEIARTLEHICSWSRWNVIS